MPTLKALSIFIVFLGFAARAHATETVNYDDPNLAFTSQYVSDQKPEASLTLKTLSEGNLAQQPAIRVDGAPWAAAPHATRSPSASAH